MADKNLAGGFAGHLLSIQGDLDFFASALSLPRWSVNSGGCVNCRCTFAGPTTWQKFNSIQHILDMEWTAPTWKVWEGKSPCKLFSIPYVTATNVFLDYLHVKYLGSDQYMFAGVLWLLVFIIRDDTPANNLQYIWSRIKFWYKQLKVRHQYHYFNRLTMFVRKSGGMKLRGRGAEVQGLTEVLLKIWEEECNPSMEVHRMVLAMLRHNHKMEDILQEHKNETALPRDAAKDFVNSAFAMAQLNHLLFDHFKDEEGIPAIFVITLKLHCVLHIALHAHEISPRLTWNFTGEDEMGILKVLGQNCCRGVQPQDVCGKMLLHWRFAMHSEMLQAWKDKKVL